MLHLTAELSVRSGLIINVDEWCSQTETPNVNDWCQIERDWLTVAVLVTYPRGLGFIWLSPDLILDNWVDTLRGVQLSHVPGVGN